MNKAQLQQRVIDLTNELEARNVRFDRLEAYSLKITAELHALRDGPVVPAQRTFKRAVKVMSLDRGWAFHARKQLSKDGSIVAVCAQRVTRADGSNVVAYAVY